MHTPRRQNPEQLYDTRQHNAKCVCQICTCGKHGCPKPRTKFDAQTTNNAHYKPYQLTSQKYQRSPYVFANSHYDPQAMKTSYGQDYTPHRIQKEPYREPARYTPNGGKFYDETQYKKSYVPNEIPLQRPSTNGASRYLPNKTKFEGRTTYNDQYSPKKIEKVVTPRHTYERKQLPFEGRTSYNDQYTPYKIEPQSYAGDHNVYKPSNAKFQGKTHYQEEYKTHEIPVAQKCPIVMMPHYPRECSPGKSHLHYSLEKNQWD